MISRRLFVQTSAIAGSLLTGRAAGRIRAGCQTRAYGVPIRDRDRLLAILEELVELGFEGFETNFNSLQSAFDEPAPVRAAIEKRKIALIGLHTSARLHDSSALEKDRALLDRVSKGTRDLGGTHLFMSGPGVPRDEKGRMIKEALSRRSDELNRAGRMCSERGLRLCIHNHAKELENGAEELKATLAATDPEHVSLVVDLSYVHLARLNPEDLIREHSKRIAAVHMRDMKGREEALLGTGEMDYAAVARAFRSVGWSGWAILEMNQRKDMTSRDMVRHGREYMRDAMKI